MLITKSVKVKWNGANRKWYEERGYVFTKIGDEFEVNIEDLTDGAIGKIKVDVLCDNKLCKNKIHSIIYKNYLKGCEKHGEYICYDCIRGNLYKYDAKGSKITLNDKGKRICNIEGCNNVYYAQGYCCSHYDQFSTKDRKCSVEGCDKPHYSLGYCKNHHSVFKRFGYIPDRNRNDESEILLHNNYAEIVLYNKEYEPHMYVKIDLDDVEKIKPYKWRVGSNGYICGWIEDKTVSLHRFIMNSPSDKVVHHKNHIKSDNRKCNLSICTQLENSFDKIYSEDKNKTGCTGVTINKKNSKKPFIAYISAVLVDKSGNLGSYDTLGKATFVREIAEIYYYKEFSPKYEILKEKYKAIYDDIIENGIQQYINNIDNLDLEEIL